MLKKFCSILLSSLLAFSVSNKKSDAGLLNDILKTVGASGFFLVALVVNNIIMRAKIAGDNYGAFNNFWYTNRCFVPIYVFFGSLYAIGECCDIYDTIMAIITVTRKMRISAAKKQRFLSRMNIKIELNEK